MYTKCLSALLQSAVETEQEEEKEKKTNDEAMDVCDTATSHQIPSNSMDNQAEDVDVDLVSEDKAKVTVA